MVARRLADLECMRQVLQTGQLTDGVHKTLLALQQSEEGWAVGSSMLDAGEDSEVHFYGALMIYTKLRSLASASNVEPYMWLKPVITEAVSRQVRLSMLESSPRSRRYFRMILRCMALFLVLCVPSSKFRLSEALDCLRKDSSSDEPTTSAYHQPPAFAFSTLVYFTKTLAEECSSAIERSPAITGVRQALTREMDLVIGIFKHVLSNETDPTVLSECIAASAEWMDSVLTESVLLTRSDLVDLLYRLAPTSPVIYTSVCDALTKIFNCGHCGLEANKRTQSMLLHQLSLLTSLQPSFCLALEFHCAGVQAVDEEDPRGQYGAVIQSTASLLEALADLQMERIVEELVAHPERAGVVGTLTFFEMLTKFFTTPGCYLLQEEYSAQLMEAWFSYQSALLDLVSSSDSTITTTCRGVNLAYQIYGRFLQALFGKISYPSVENWQELIENDRWHAYRQDVLDAFLASLNHPERRDWLLESYNSLVSLSDRWIFTPSEWNALESHLFVLGGLSEELNHYADRTAQLSCSPGDDFSALTATSPEVPLCAIAGTVIQTVTHLASSFSASNCPYDQPGFLLVHIAGLSFLSQLHPLVRTCYRLARRLPDPGHIAGMSEVESRLLSYPLFCLRVEGPKGHAETSSAVSTLSPDILLWLLLIASALSAISEFLQNTTHLTRNDAEALLSTLTDAGVRLAAISNWCQPVCSLLRRRMFYCVGRLFTFISEPTSVTQFAQIYLLPVLTEAEGARIGKGASARLEEITQAKKYLQPAEGKLDWTTAWSKEVNHQTFGGSSTQLFELLITLCSFGEFFRGVGEVTDVSLGSAFYTEECLHSTYQPHARTLVRSLALRIFKLLERLTADDHTVLTEMSEMITWLCKVALLAAFRPNDKHDSLPAESSADEEEVSSNVELITALHDFVCASCLSREESIADCLPLCWLLFEHLASAGGCLCSHHSQTITFATCSIGGSSKADSSTS
ncbi:Importin-13 [Sparganum proliferum]